MGFYSFVFCNQTEHNAIVSLWLAAVGGHGFCCGGCGSRRRGWQWWRNGGGSIGEGEEGDDMTIMC